jgi:hypothetical protein
MNRGLQVLGLVVAITLAFVAAQIAHPVAKVSSVLCGAIALGLLFFRETHISFEKRVITEVTRFLSIVPITRRIWLSPSSRQCVTSTTQAMT